MALTHFNHGNGQPECRDRNAGSRTYMVIDRWEDVTCKSCLKRREVVEYNAAHPIAVETHQHTRDCFYGCTEDR